MSSTVPRMFVFACVLGVAAGCADGGGTNDAGADLSVAQSDLAGLDLAGADLLRKGPDLSGVDLQGADFSGQPSLTPCPEGGTQFCDRATEVCVVRSLHGPVVPVCEPIPAGCQNDRTCGCMQQPICGDAKSYPCSTDPMQDNTVHCACPAC